jgi:PAS domain S-box-containing protein
MERTHSITHSRQDVYQRMIEDIADYAILLLDASGNVATWNKGAQQIKGYAAGEIIGKHFSIFYTQEDKAAGLPQSLLEKAATEGKAMTEGWRVKKGGGRFWGSVLITPIRDDDGVLTGFGKITRDLTDKKKNEDALLKFNNELEQAVAERHAAFDQLQYQYHHIFRNNPLPMWIMDIDTFKFLEVNEVAETAYGYSREEFMNMTVLDIRPEADRDAFMNALRPAVVGKDNFYRGIWQHQKKDGTVIEVEIFAHDIDFEGRQARLILSHDITYRRIAEKKLAGRVRYFRALLENNYDAILLYDEQGVVSYQSPASERMLGYTQEDIRHVNALDLFHADDKEEVLKKLKEALANPSRAIWVISRMKHKDGYNIWVEGTLTNLLEDDNVKAIVGNFRDVTERKLNAEQLLKSKREVEKVYREQIILSERMSSIFNALPANTALINNEGNIVSVNDAWRRSSNSDDFIGASYGIDDNYLDIIEMAGGDDGRRIAKAIRSILAGQAREYSTEYCLGKKGAERWLRAIISRENNNPDSGIVLMHIDITDRVNAEQKAIVQRKQIENLLKGMGDAFMTIDGNWQFTFANEHALTLMRKTREEVQGQVIWELFSDIRNTRFETELRRVATTQKDAEFEILYPAYDLWLHVRVYPHDNGLAVFYNNITERKKAEQELQASEYKFRALTDNAPDMLELYDEDLKLSYCSLSVEKSFATTLEKISGTSIYANIYPEDMVYAQSLVEEVLNNHGVAIPFILRKQHGDADFIYVEGTMCNLLDDAAVAAIVCNYRDVTARRVAEQQLESSYREIERLLQHTQEAFIMLDASLKVTSCNNNARKFGITYLKSEIVPGMPVADLALPEGMESYPLLLAQVLKGERREVEMKFEKKGAGKIYFLNLMTPVMDNEGRVEGVFITIRNITEKKAAQEKIEFDRNNLSALINNTNDLIWSVDEQFRLLTSNTAFDETVMQMSGHKAKLGSKLRAGFGKEQLSRWDNWYARALKGESFNAIEYTPHPADRWAETSFYPIRNGEKVIGVACYSRDITIRIQSEKKIVNANRLYAFMSAINQTIVHSSSTEEVFREACRIAVETGEFKMAWIGLIDKEKKVINLVEDNGMSAMERSLFLNMPYNDNGPTDRMLKTGGYFYSNDVLNDRRIQRWRPYARNTGVNSIMLLPIRKGSEIIGAFNLYATELNLFDTEEIKMLEEVAGDISFSIEVFEKEAQRKETLEKLRLNEARLNEAQEIARVGNWEIDLKTGAQTWSQEAKRIIGYNPDSSLPVFESYLSSIHPDDRLSVMRMITESRTSHENVFFYCRVMKGSEVRYIYSESKYEFDEHNVPVRLHGILHDITNAKVAEDTLAQSEENLRLIIDLIPQAIYARDVNGKLLFVNKSFAKLFGQSPGQLISSSITDGGTKDLLSDKDRLVIATGRTEVLPELECKDSEGNNRIFYTIKVPYTLAGSKEVAVLGIAMDVTERKLAELERNRIIADMIQRNKDLEQFSYIISHNLRAPVANISGIADIMQFDDMGEEEEAELMKELLSSVDKLDSVIKDLNYILQVKQEYSEIREVVNFADLMTDIQQSIRNLITNEKVQVITDFTEVNGMMTLKSYLYSVMYNLLSNSIKYRRPGVPPVIRISSRKVDGKIVIEFEDNGLGIDLNKKGGQVFGLYKRFHSHTEGKGIGLYMVKTQVETLGGHIHIESEVNKGTKFIIEFDKN